MEKKKKNYLCSCQKPPRFTTREERDKEGGEKRGQKTEISCMCV